MVDRGAESFQVAAGPSTVAAVLHVFATLVGIYGSQHFAAPEFVGPANAGVEVVNLVACVPRIGKIDRQHVGAVDLLDVAPATFADLTWASLKTLHEHTIINHPSQTGERRSK
jgi:hypothetical protein